MKDYAQPKELEVKEVEGGNLFLSLSNTVLTMRFPAHLITWDIPVERVKITNIKKRKSFSFSKLDAIRLTVDTAFLVDEHMPAIHESVVFWMPREQEQREQLKIFLWRIEDAQKQTGDCHDKVVKEGHDKPGCLKAGFWVVFNLATVVGGALCMILFTTKDFRETHELTWFISVLCATFLLFLVVAICGLTSHFSQPRFVRKINRCFDENKFEETLKMFAEFETQNALNQNLAIKKIRVLARLRRFDEAFATLEKHRPLFDPDEWQFLWDETHATQRIHERKTARAPSAP